MWLALLEGFFLVVVVFFASVHKESASPAVLPRIQGLLGLIKMMIWRECVRASGGAR